MDDKPALPPRYYEEKPPLPPRYYYDDEPILPSNNKYSMGNLDGRIKRSFEKIKTSIHKLHKNCSKVNPTLV